MKIAHEPAYHTYSRWEIGDQTLVFAYRDVDKQPLDMAADIYLLSQKGYKLVGRAEIPGIVTDVATAKLTEGEFPDVIIHFEAGLLKYIDVLRFSKGKAHQVFQYGASEMKIQEQPKPRIEAVSKSGNLVEVFAWDSQSSEFTKISEHPWHKSD